MSNKPIVDHLNHLITANKDAEASYQAAGENVRNSELETLFKGYASQHAHFAAEIQEEVERARESPADSGTLGGSVQRKWLGLKATLTDHAADSILSACESVEQSAESTYLDALEVITTGHIHALLQKHCQKIKEFRTRLARLVAQMKDGLDFQKNE